MKLGTFTSIPMQDGRGEFGVLEHDVFLDEKLITASGAPKDFIITHLALELSGLVESHGLPPSMWSFTPTKVIRRRLNWPGELDFSKGMTL